MIFLVLGFAVLVFFIVLAGVALVAGAANRRARLRSSLAWFAAAAAATVIALVVLSGASSFAQLESAMLYGATFLVAVALALVARAFLVSRPRPPLDS